MPSPPTEPDARAAAVTTCTCGYDLSGLPVDAAAKCPECGAVIVDLVPTNQRLVPGWVLCIAFVSPAMFVMALISVIEVLQPAWIPPDFGIGGRAIILGLFVFVSIPAGCVYAYEEFPSMVVWNRAVLMIFIILLSLIANISIVGVVESWFSL